MTLIRMIGSIARWDGSAKVDRKDATIGGDAVSDLRTVNNELSVWAGDTAQDKDDAVVALALGRDSVQKLCYLELDENELAKIEIKAEDESGNVKGLTEELRFKHKNLVQIDYKRIGLLAEYMVKLTKDKRYHSKSKTEIKSLLVKYKSEGKINPAEVKSDRIKAVLIGSAE